MSTACRRLAILLTASTVDASPFGALPPGAPAPYALRWVNVHEAAHSTAHAINDRGVVGGNWSPADGAAGAGVLHSTSALQTLVMPAPPRLSLGVRHLNAAGDATGFMDDDAFVRRGAAVTLLAPPGTARACGRGIAADGTVVGDATGAEGSVAWRWHSATGYSLLAGLPGGTAHGATGINGAGTIIGWSRVPSSTDPAVMETTAWLHAGGTFTPFSWPGTTTTSQAAINDHGDLLVGFRMASSGTRDRFAVHSGGDFHEINLTLPAGMNAPAVRGLNSLGEIAGFCVDAAGRRHAFRGVPAWLPEITDSHTDLTLRIQSGQPTIEVNDTDLGQTFAPDRVVIRAGASARRLVPASTAFGFLGPAGASAWILPQAQDYALPWLGVSSLIPAGVLQGNQVHLTLEALTGPGHFQLYTVSGFGSPTVRMNTADGISPTADRVTLASGAHVHYNWAFSAPGLWKLRFRIRGTPAAGDAEIVSAIQELTLWFDTGSVFPLTMSPPQPGPAGMQLALNTEVGRELVLRTSTDLINWSISQRVLTTSPLTTLTEPASGPRRFYQAVLR